MFSTQSICIFVFMFGCRLQTIVIGWEKSWPLIGCTEFPAYKINNLRPRNLSWAGSGTQLLSPWQNISMQNCHQAMISCQRKSNDKQTIFDMKCCIFEEIWNLAPGKQSLFSSVVERWSRKPGVVSSILTGGNMVLECGKIVHLLFLYWEQMFLLSHTLLVERRGCPSWYSNIWLSKLSTFFVRQNCHWLLLKFKI